MSVDAYGCDRRYDWYDAGAVRIARAAQQVARHERLRRRLRKRDAWYCFQDLRFVRNALWAQLQMQRRALHLPVFRVDPPDPPLIAVVNSAPAGSPRLVRRPPLAGGAEDRGARSREMVCSIQRRDGAICLAVAGELDLASVASFLGSLKKASDAGDDIVLDLSGLKYIDSSGINALLDAQHRFSRTGQRIVMAAVSPRIQRILEIITLEKVIPVYPTVEEALTRLHNGGPDGTKATP
jgi:anti-anti-sigma factor